MIDSESDYWSDEISDAEIDALADAGDRLPMPKPVPQKSGVQKAVSKRRQQMAKAAEKGDREAFSKLLGDPQRLLDALTDVEGQVLQLADEILDNATVAGRRALMRKLEKTIAKLKDAFDDLENVHAKLNPPQEG